MSNWAIILAAGASQRMGTCKAALPWGGDQNLLTYQIQQFFIAEIGAIVVLNPQNTELVNLITDLRKLHQVSIKVIVNSSPERGKTSSILLGLSQLPPNFATVIISAVDQPRPATIYQHLLQTWQENQASIVAPTFQGKTGHPLLFSRKLLSELLTISEANLGLRQVIQKYRQEISYLEAEEIVLADLNTPDAYQKARDKATAKL